MLRGGAVAIAGSTFVVAGLLGAAAIRTKVRENSTRSADPATPVTAVADAGTASAAATPAAPAPSTAQPDVPAVKPPAVVQEGTTQAPTPISPIIPIGESVIERGVTALRADSSVTLSFDTPTTRTRIPEKFERFVRTTLPVIYGPGIESVLATIPEGTIANQGNLTAELPTRGVRIPVGAAWMLRLYPETRPGQDGPLVVRYRVAVVPAGE